MPGCLTHAAWQVGLAVAVARGAASPACIPAALSPCVHISVPLGPAFPLLLVRRLSVAVCR